jgi:hypothetical protein
VIGSPLDSCPGLGVIGGGILPGGALIDVADGEGGYSETGVLILNLNLGTAGVLAPSAGDSGGTMLEPRRAEAGVI